MSGQMSCEKWTNVPWYIGNPPICFQQASNRITFPVHLPYICTQLSAIRCQLAANASRQGIALVTMLLPCYRCVTHMLPPCYYVTDSGKQKQGQHHSAPCFCKNLFMKYCCPLPVTTVVLVILTLPSGLLIVRSFTSNSFSSMALCVGIL